MELDFASLEPGSLATIFKNGTSAVVLRGDRRVLQAWDRLVGSPRETLPWEATMIDIARNHYAGNDVTDTIGDMYYFKPGRHANIARKLELTRQADSEKAMCRPKDFVHGDQVINPDPDLLDTCWEITNRIMQGMTPVSTKSPPSTVVLQRIKYQEIRNEIHQLFSLTNSGLGRWGQLGYAIDTRREQARGALSPRGVADLFAIFSMLPGFHKGMDALNAFFARRDLVSNVPGDAEIIGKEHIDSRFFSGLCGIRNNVRTEVLFEDRWLELPIENDSITVIPGNRAKTHFDVPPVKHRIIHTSQEQTADSDHPGMNVTLLFGSK